jgi:hypothetical protein
LETNTRRLVKTMNDDTCEWASGGGVRGERMHVRACVKQWSVKCSHELCVKVFNKSNQLSKLCLQSLYTLWNTKNSLWNSQETYCVSMHIVTTVFQTVSKLLVFCNISNLDVNVFYTSLHINTTKHTSMDTHISLSLPNAFVGPCPALGSVNSG